MSNAAEARKQVEVLLYEKIIGFYDRRKARVDTDPKWAEGNPILLMSKKMKAANFRFYYHRSWTNLQRKVRL